MEKHIKERLVGAIVLVAIVVIVVPELLTGPRERAPVAPPPEMAAPVRTVTIDLATGAQRDAVAADRVGEAPLASDPASSPSATAAPGSVAPPAESVASADAAGGTPESAGGVSSSTAPASVGVGSAPRADAPPLPNADAPAVAGEPPVKSPTSPQTVARESASQPAPAASTKAADAKSAPAPKPGGPTATRSPDPRTAPKPSNAPPRPAAPSTTGAEGWVVQLGSFASRPNAERLVAELRAKGYAGFVSEFRGSGRVLYRVRVGPEQDRARAEAIAQRLAREGKKGTIAPHP